VDKLRDFGAALVGVLALGGLLVLSCVMIYGLPRVSLIIYDLVAPLSTAAFLVDLLLLPFALLRKPRRTVGLVLIGSSYLFGLILWTYSAMTTYALWGYFGLFFGLAWIGVGVVPVALLASLLTSSWGSVANVLAGLALTFGARVLGLALANTKAVHAPADGQSDVELKIMAQPEVTLESSPVWYAATNGERKGPYDESTLRLLVETGEVAPDDLVWRAGLVDWVHAAQVSALYLPPPVPVPGQVQMSREKRGAVSMPPPETRRQDVACSPSSRHS
jgi:hypothetical protein